MLPYEDDKARRDAEIIDAKVLSNRRPPYGITGGLGFLLAIYLFSTVRERLEFADYPKAFEGFPIALITAGLIALAFMGCSGLQVWPV